MVISILSWNMYFGNILDHTLPEQLAPNAIANYIAEVGPGTSPVQRFNYIAQLAANYNVDVVCLQEHPGQTSQLTNNVGLLNNALVPHNYMYQVFPEMNRNEVMLVPFDGFNGPQIGGNVVSASNRAYAILINNVTCNLIETNYFHR